MIRKNVYLDEISYRILEEISQHFRISHSLVIRLALSYFKKHKLKGVQNEKEKK